MTDAKEIRALAERMRARGAQVELRADADGYLDSVQITHAPGIGPHAMGLVAAAEAMRAWLVAEEGQAESLALRDLDDAIADGDSDDWRGWHDEPKRTRRPKPDPPPKD
ncbi:hypothetical protein [Falsiroseomonas tokyonensis]|uniref:Uncharacterized protein n=1 Tax=Falsiroseomonas tokyonensis TaxID=430521 RepID=A0ABV7BYY7_9PROT|nr:hypothetical protein [Falsiroseomonas tokyonensis]MBU8540200.1 hypothetical protein [Falsiroseomonas tokyonensis]